MAEEFLKALLRLSLLGSLLAGLLLLLYPLLQRWASARTAYYLWLLVLLRLCIPVGLTLSTPAVGGQLLSPPYDGWAPTQPAAVPNAPQVPEAPVPAGETAAGPVGAEPGVQALPAAPERPEPSIPSQSPDPEAWVFPVPPATVLAAIWALGALACLGRYIWGYRRFRRALGRSARRVPAEKLRLLWTMDPAGQVRLEESPLVNTPLLVGALRPVIVLPCGITQEECLRDILAHELTHARRHDLLYKWFAAAVTSLHWFNPLMPLVRRRISRACELACDEAVVLPMSPAQRKHYGETLLALAAAPPAELGPLGATLCEEKSQLKERLVSIVHVKKNGPLAALISLVLALAVGGCALIGDARPTPTPEGGDWKAVVDSFNPNATPLPEEDAVLYETGGFTVAFPKEIYDQLLILPGVADADGGLLTLLSVYEKRSYEESMADYGFGGGWLFTISRRDQAQYEQFLTSDGSGMRHFARDGEGYYYCWETATDVQFYRSGLETYTQEALAPWGALCGGIEGIQPDFIARNGLEPYDDSAFFSRDFTYEGEHRYVRFVVDSIDVSLMLTLSQPVRQGEGGVWCVERYQDRYGGIYPVFSMEGTPTPQDRGIAAAEHYQSLQDAADRGERPDLLHPLDAARTWLKNCYYPFQEDTLNTCAVLMEGEPGGNVWGRLGAVLEQSDFLETLRIEDGTAVDVQAFHAPENEYETGLYSIGYRNLADIFWLKAEAGEPRGNAVRCTAPNGDQILFLDRDGVTGVQSNGVWEWFRPALKVSPYQLMYGLCQQWAGEH